jgi:uncharacterized protein involved in response to NO
MSTSRAPPASLARDPAHGTAFLSYGFRPFFLLAASYAVAALAALVGGLVLGVWPARALPPARWHGHEMLFGFVAAAIAGFLLTAVPTWTNRRPVAGGALVRVAGPALLPAYYLPLVTLAMVCWASAFLIFVAVYLPILIEPREDGA